LSLTFAFRIQRTSVSDVKRGGLEAFRESWNDVIHGPQPNLRLERITSYPKSVNRCVFTRETLKQSRQLSSRSDLKRRSLKETQKVSVHDRDFFERYRPNKEAQAQEQDEYW